MAITTTLYSADNATMASNWTDTVYLTLRKDGAISVLGEIYGEDPNTGRWRKYRMDGSAIGIRSPSKLLQVLRDFEDQGRLEFDAMSLVDTLEELDTKWALSTLKLLYQELIRPHE